MIEKLREINNKILEVAPSNYKQQLIKKLLQTDDCFFKMNINLIFDTFLKVKSLYPDDYGHLRDF